jgi:hypothetical protein
VEKNLDPGNKSLAAAHGFKAPAVCRKSERNWRLTGTNLAAKCALCLVKQRFVE